MRAKVDTAHLGFFLVTETERAREAMAMKVFDLNTLKEACVNAAVKGLPGITITPPTSVDLSRTKAAQKAREWLKSQGVRVEWQNRTDPATGEILPVFVLSWA